MAKWKKIGSLRKSKKGGLYIKLDESISLQKDTSLTLQNPRESVDRLVSSGKITAQEGETRKSKIPDYIRYEVFLIEE